MSTIKADGFIRAGSRETPYIPNIRSEQGRPIAKNAIANRGLDDQAEHGRIKPGDRVVVCMVPEFKAVVVSVHRWYHDVFVATIATDNLPASLLLINRDMPIDNARNVRAGTRATVQMRVTVDRLVHDRSSLKAKTPRNRSGGSS